MFRHLDIEERCIRIYLGFLSIPSASAMMCTSHKFYVMINPLLSNQFKDIKLELVKCAERHALRLKAEKIHHAVVLERLS